MVTKEILAYIDTQLKNGFSLAEIRSALLAGGWTREDSEMAIATVRPQELPVDFMPTATPAPKERAPLAAASYQPPGVASVKIQQQRSAAPPQQPLQRPSPLFPASQQQKPVGVASPMDPGRTVQLHPSATWSPSVLMGKKTQGGGGGRWIISFLLLAIFAGGGAFAYYQYFRKMSPELAIPLALKNLLNAASFRYNADMTITTGAGSASLLPLTASEEAAGILTALFAHSSSSPISPEESLSPQVSGSLKLHAEGGYDRHNSAHPVGSAKIRATVASKEFGDFSLGGEVRLTQSAVYAKITEVPPIGVDLSGIKDQWVSADIASLQNTTPATPGENPPAPAKRISSGLTAVEIARLQDIISSTSFFANITELQKETIDGADTSHYGFDINTSGVSPVLKELVIIGKARGRERGNAATTDADIDRTAEEFVRAIKKLQGEIWLSEGDLLPRRIVMSMSIADEKNPAIQGTIQLSVKYADFNKVYEVKPPTGARPLAEVLGGVMAQQKKSRDARRIIDLKQIMLGLEFYAENQKAPLYPSSLSLLAPRFLPVLPTDPGASTTTVPYNYSSSPDRKSYHLGASLELLGSSALGNDADFNSKSVGWKGGFDGADFKKCADRDRGITCFDLKP